MLDEIAAGRVEESLYIIWRFIIEKKEMMSRSEIDPIYPIRIGHDKMPYHWTDLLPMFEKEYEDRQEIQMRARSNKLEEAKVALKEFIGFGR